jgi:hypothetical protein
MLGTLRLTLAMLVAAYHFGTLVFGISAGIASVVCFYIISGYAMTGLMLRRYPSPLRQLKALPGPLPPPQSALLCLGDAQRLRGGYAWGGRQQLRHASHNMDRGDREYYSHSA